MNWAKEIRTYGPIRVEKTADFAVGEAKSAAVLRYNRAVRQIRRGNTDVAAISLKALCKAHPHFREAAQLSACCQMLWRDADAAAETLQPLLYSTLLTEAEQRGVQRYLEAIAPYRSTEESKTDALPRFKEPEKGISILEETDSGRPMELAARHEIEMLKEGKTYREENTDEPGRPRRKTTIGSSLRHSESLLGDRLREARYEAEQKRRKEAEKRRIERARREVEAQQKRRAEEEAKRRAEEEAKRRVEEEAKRRAEEEAKRRAEEEAKRRAEEEAKRRAEEEAKRRATQENLVAGIRSVSLRLPTQKAANSPSSKDENLQGQITSASSKKTAATVQAGPVTKQPVLPAATTSRPKPEIRSFRPILVKGEPAQPTENLNQPSEAPVSDQLPLQQVGPETAGKAGPERSRTTAPPTGQLLEGPWYHRPFQPPSPAGGVKQRKAGQGNVQKARKVSPSATGHTNRRTAGSRRPSPRQQGPELWPDRNRQQQAKQRPHRSGRTGMKKTQKLLALIVLGLLLVLLLTTLILVARSKGREKDHAVATFEPTDLSGQQTVATEAGGSYRQVEGIRTDPTGVDRQ